MSNRSRPPLDREAHVDAAWTLVRWLGIPLVLVGALYFVQRGFDHQPFTVVTDRGSMPSPGEIAAKPPKQTQPTQPTTIAPIVTPAIEPTPPIAPPSEPVTILEPIVQPAPPYPVRALAAEREGRVRLRLTISPDGSVEDSTVLDAEPRGWFERAAQEGVKRWRYEPSESGGIADVDVEFKLK